MISEHRQGSLDYFEHKPSDYGSLNYSNLFLQPTVEMDMSCTGDCRAVRLGTKRSHEQSGANVEAKRAKQEPAAGQDENILPVSQTTEDREFDSPIRNADTEEMPPALILKPISIPLETWEQVLRSDGFPDGLSLLNELKRQRETKRLDDYTKPDIVGRELVIYQEPSALFSNLSLAEPMDSTIDLHASCHAMELD